MLALIAGRGTLPKVVAAAQTRPPLVCALEGAAPEGLSVDLSFRLERLGSFFALLKRRGVTRVCLAGGIDRPALDPLKLDLRTLALLPRILTALRRGDDGALRAALGLFERAGFEIVAAHEAAPGLLPSPGVPTQARPGPEAREEALLGDRVIAEMGRADLGQASIIRGASVLAREGDNGTDAMLRGLGYFARGAVLYKAPKPGQDRRVDLPTIGPGTADRVAEKALRGIIVEAGGVIVLEPAEVIRRLDRAGAFLWVREPGA
ncbi:LpxI family protein [Roseivivax sp. CAU 1761]